MRASTSKLSYVPGEQVEISYEIEEGDLPFSEVSNISTDVFRASVARNDLMIGFGKSPVKRGTSLMVSVRLPENTDTGTCFISGATFMGPNAEVDQGAMRKVQFEPVFFDIRPHFSSPTTWAEIEADIQKLEKQRKEFSNRPHTTASANTSGAPVVKFIVMIFAVGCLIHGRQQLEGYTISPTGVGLSHKRLLDIMNSELAKEEFEPLMYQAELEEQFARGTPTVAIKYACVRAVSHDDALDYCRGHSRLIFELLGRNQGQIPREFGGVAIEIGSTNRWQFFEMPGYRGNLVSDFSPDALAKSIERTLPILENNSFARLLTRVFAEATGETDFGYRFLRFWTVLELVADRKISNDGSPLMHPDGRSILKSNGNSETTNSKHGRIYKYILLSGNFTTIHSYQENGANRTIIVAGDVSNPNFGPGSEVFSLWEVVRAACAVRNSVAHEGHFDATTASAGDQYQRLAARLMQPPFLLLQGFIEDIAKRTVDREA
jgi:hypothetical protein